MPNDVKFEEILELFESQGWELARIWKPYRVFMKEGELPFLVPVRDGKVDIEYVRKIEDFFKD